MRCNMTRETAKAVSPIQYFKTATVEIPNYSTSYTINMGFTPKAVLLITDKHVAFGCALTGFSVTVQGQNHWDDMLEIVSNGIRLSGSLYPSSNLCYVAFG